MADCNPSNHLLFNTKIVTLDRELAYSYFQGVSSDKAESMKRDAGLEFVLEGVPMNLKYDDAATISSHYSTETGTQLRQYESSVMIEKRLADKSLEGYIECLKGVSPLVVRVQEVSEDWATTTFDIDWDPKSVTANGTLTVSIEGGTLANGDTTVERADWQRGSSEQFTVHRVGNKQITFKAMIDGQSSTRIVPNKPVIIPVPVYERRVELPGLIRGGYYGKGVVQDEVEIVAYPGTFLLPASARPLVHKNYGRPDWRPEDLTAEVVDPTPNRIVFRVRNAHGDNPGVSSIFGTGTVLQVGSFNVK